MYYYVFFALVIFAVLWFMWLNGALKSQRKIKAGVNETTAPVTLDATAYTESAAVESFEAGGFKNFMKSMKAKPAKKTKEEEPTAIQRSLLIEYSDPIYINKAFPLRVNIAKKGEAFSAIIEDKKIKRVETLSFKAFQKEPDITVEVKFTEGDFKVNQPKRTQKLSETTDTVFSFMVVPLKAEDCVLTIVFSYTDKVPLFKVSQKVSSKTTKTETGKTETTETSDAVTHVPVDSTQQIEILTIDLVISVKQLLRLNAPQLDIVKKAVPIILALVFFAYQIGTSKEGIAEAAIAAAPAVITAFGIEGADKWFSTNKTEDKDK